MVIEGYWSYLYYSIYYYNGLVVISVIIDSNGLVVISVIIDSNGIVVISVIIDSNGLMVIEGYFSYWYYSIYYYNGIVVISVIIDSNGIVVIEGYWSYLYYSIYYYNGLVVIPVIINTNCEFSTFAKTIIFITHLLLTESRLALPKMRIPQDTVYSGSLPTRVDNQNSADSNVSFWKDMLKYPRLDAVCFYIRRGILFLMLIILFVIIFWIGE